MKKTYSCIPLNEVAEIWSGIAFPIHLQGKKKGDYPFAKVGDISRFVRGGYYEINDAENYIDYINLKELRAKLFPPNSIVFAKIGEAIKQNFKAISSREMLFDNNVMGIIPKTHKVFSRFLFHFTRTINLTNFINTTSVPSLRKTDIESILIPLPPLAEQQRIAAILDKADALREKRRRTIAKLDELLESSFSQLYENKSLLNTVKLEDVAEKSRGSFVNGPFGSDLLTSELTKSGVPVIYIRDIRDGEYNRVSESFVSKGKAEKLSVCSVFPGDVLIAKVGDPPGTAALYPQTEPPGIVTQDVIRIRINSQIVTPEFLVSYFNSPIGRWNISKIVIEATRARFSLTELKQLCLEVPLIQQQRKFSIIAQKISVLKLKQKKALYRLEQLFLSLQQRAFSGELFTQQANEELNAATNEEKTGQMSLFDLMG